MPTLLPTDAKTLATSASIEEASWLIRGFRNPIRKVVQLHTQFSRGEVDADMLLGGNGQGGVLLVVILRLQGGTVGNQNAIRQADTQR